MRILLATWHRHVVGGAESYLRSLIPELLQRGHELALVHGYNTITDRETIDLPQHHLPRWCFQDLGIEGVLQGVGQWAPDVVFSQGLDSVALESALLGAHPTVLYAHGYYGTCESGSKCYTRPQRKACSRAFGPACLVFHYTRGCGGLNPLTALSNYRRQSKCNSLLRRFPAVLVASQHMQRELLNNGVEDSRLHLVHLPPTGLLPLAEEPVNQPSTGRILLSCRLTKVKGGEYLLKAVPEAAKELKRELQAVIAGSGSEEQKLRELALQTGVSAQFVGWVEASRRADLIRSCDLVAFPSIWNEPFGLSGIEAGGFGVPAVGYALGGIPEWLISGYSGELAPADPPTSGGLAAAIVRALADPDHYRKLSVGAWTVARRFSWQTHLDKLEAVFHSTVSGITQNEVVKI